MIKELTTSFQQGIWDTIAESFDLTRKTPWDICVEFIQTLPSKWIVGDFGCGNGRHSILMANQCKNVICIDFSQNLLSIIQEKTTASSKVNLVCSDLTKIPLKDNTFDAVLFIASLHNIPKKINRITALAELHRTLKPDGIALLSVWNKNIDYYNSIKKNSLNLNIPTYKLESGDVFIFWNQNGLHVPRFYHLYEKPEIIKEIENSGFHIDSFKNVRIASKKTPDNYFIQIKKLSVI